MIAYILSSDDLSIKDVLQFETDSFNTDIKYANKSSISVTRQPNIKEDDIVLCKSEDNETEFIGICETASSEDSITYTISLLQKENLFNRKIFIENESLISSTGIEDFVAAAIRSNWINTGDSLLDKTYMSVTAATHTRINTTTGQTGAFNLKDFLATANELYRLLVDFVITDGALAVRIYVDNSPILPLDATVSDVESYKETYNSDTICKVIAQWYQGDTFKLNRTYYLLSDGSITTNAAAAGRVKAKTSSEIIKAETEDAFVQSVTNIFTQNKYEHKISMNLIRKSQIYPLSDYYVGRRIRIFTDSKITDSVISSIAFGSGSEFITMICGTYKETLIEKLRGAK